MYNLSDVTTHFSGENFFLAGNPLCAISFVEGAFTENKRLQLVTSSFSGLGKISAQELCMIGGGLGKISILELCMMGGGLTEISTLELNMIGGGLGKMRCLKGCISDSLKGLSQWVHEELHI